MDKLTCNLHFPDGTIIPVHIWNRVDLNNGLRLN